MEIQFLANHYSNAARRERIARRNQRQLERHHDVALRDELAVIAYRRRWERP